MYKENPSKPGRAVIANLEKAKKVIDGPEFKTVYANITDNEKYLKDLKELVNSKNQEVCVLALHILKKFVDVGISSKKTLTSEGDAINKGK